MSATAGRPETLETLTTEGTSIAIRTAAGQTIADAPGKSTAVRTLPIAGSSTEQETTETSGDANNSRDARSSVTPFSMGRQQQ
jgi:hypothetical protein